MNNSAKDWTENVDTVIDNDLRFKAKLNIGEDAFTSLKLKKYLLDAVDAGNGALTGVAVAKSSIVASAFFAPSGLLGAIGIGTAVTPVGWAIAAGALGAGLSVAIGKKIVRGSSSRVTVIPEFINTPLDILAVGLFDMIATLGLKIAAIDGNIDDRELVVASQYFVKEWGYSEDFVNQGIKHIIAELGQHTVQGIATQLAEFKKKNPDCNYDSMSAEVLLFIDKIIEADLVIDEREEMAREKVKHIFDEVNSFSMKGVVGSASSGISRVAKAGAGAIESTASSVRESISNGWNKIIQSKNKDS